jgi:hypothetical protein
MPLIGSGRADSKGAISFALDTSGIPASDLGNAPRGDERVLWGQKIDPVVARRVMADCLPRSEG